eukprot:4389752-Pleurochrysis_carterae.AAC.3
MEPDYLLFWPRARLSTFLPSSRVLSSKPMLRASPFGPHAQFSILHGTVASLLAQVIGPTYVGRGGIAPLYR